MQTTKDEYTLINLWCRPLVRTSFSFSEIRTEEVKQPKSATGTLISSLEKTETLKDSGILSAKNRPENLIKMSEEDIEIAEARARLENKEDLNALPRFRRLKAKINSKVFDYSDLEKGKIEEEIQNLVNKDGYYDEIEPIDADADYEEDRGLNTAIIIVLGLIFALITFLYFYIKHIF